MWSCAALRGLVIVLVLGMPWTAWAQDDPPPPPEAGEVGPEEAEVDLEEIDRLLQEDEAIRSSAETQFSYDPGTRRDPFLSLITVRQDLAEEQPTERPEGKEGLLIDEIVVEGIYELPDGPVAQIQAANQETSFLLRPGDQLWDGDVVSITLEEVVFKQTVDDPTALRPFRDVVKRLNP